MKQSTRVAIFLRPSSIAPGETVDQSTELARITSGRDWTTVATFHDHTNLLQAAARHEFDVAMVWSLSQLGQTTRHVIDVVNALHRHGVDLYSHQDVIDTTTSLGKSAYVSFVALARHEHEQLRERSRIALARARRNGVRLGRPTNLNDSVRAAIHVLHGQGTSIRQIARQLRVGNATIYKALQAATTSTPVQPLRDVGNGFRSPLRRSEPGRNRIPA